MAGTTKWEIVHVPGEPERSLELDTVDVLASNIEPKLANSIVRQLNEVYPLKHIRHVKRVRRRTAEGKVELSVILCLSGEHEKDTEGIPRGIHELISAYNLCPFKAKVAKHAARSKEEWEDQCNLWPTSYHPSTNLDGVATLTEGDLQLIFKYMKIAIQMTKLSYAGGKVLNAAVIVDPLIRQVIACANDQIYLLPQTFKTSDRDSSIDGCGATDVSQSTSNGFGNNQNSSVKKFSLHKCSDILSGVSCLNPWGWTAQKLSNEDSSTNTGNKYSWHPLRHAALVAIENAAARDRQMFPGSGLSVSPPELIDIPLYLSYNSPSKRQKIQVSEDHSMGEEAPNNSEPTELMPPYLCTGFDIYLVWEPCTMCAMALLHQRIRRIFFALPNPNAGALGSVYRLQGLKSLNHHYSVFQISIPEHDLHEIGENSSDNSS